jgi:hypothetical protein
MVGAVLVDDGNLHAIVFIFQKKYGKKRARVPQFNVGYPNA